MVKNMKTWKHVDDIERRLVANMRKEGIPYSLIHKITGRSTETLTKIVRQPKAVKTGMKKVGAPKKLTDKDFAQVLKAMEKLHKQSHPIGKDVTAAMITREAGLDVSDKTLQREFRNRGMKYYKLKERQTLTDDDVKKRKAWAKEYMGRRASTWVQKNPHAIIDNKHWQLLRTGAGRSHAARRTVRGAYQKRGQQPESHMVKPKGGNNKFPAAGATVTAAVIKGKIRMWEYVKGSWCGEAAASMYKGPLVKAMAKAFPNHAKKAGAKWVVMEDNDPAGYKSSKALKAKAEVGIVTTNLPPRSPDLNVLDYSLWHTINLRMGAQEESWHVDKQETAEEYMARLRRAALGVLEAEVSRAVGAMAGRCRALWDRRGRLFKEGS